MLQHWLEKSSYLKVWKHLNQATEKQQFAEAISLKQFAKVNVKVNVQNQIQTKQIA